MSYLKTKVPFHCPLAFPSDSRTLYDILILLLRASAAAPTTTTTTSITLNPK